MSTQPKVAIVGTGYVGLTCAIGFAQFGHRVIGYDIMPGRIEQLNRGVPPYHEEGLNEALAMQLELGRLRFVEHLADAVQDADFIVIAVGTPSRDDGSCDLSALDEVTTALLRIGLRYPTIVLRSTVPPGTTARLARRFEGIAQVVFAPEFLREGNALGDFGNPDRIVVGTDSPHEDNGYLTLLSHLGKPTLVTTATNAELVKCFSNAFLAMKISFANEVANVCDAFDNTDALHVLRGIGLDKRIGEAFLLPGIGFGGPCFEKDVKSLINVAAQIDATSGQLLNATMRVNELQPRRIVDKLAQEIGELNGTRIGVWGLTFKAGTNDTRDSLAIRIVEDLMARGAEVIAYDPKVLKLDSHQGCEMAASALEAAEADALLVLTEWPHFTTIDADAIASRLKRGVIIDGRNLLDPRVIADAGMQYRGVGRRAHPRADETKTGAFAAAS